MDDRSLARYLPSYGDRLAVLHMLNSDRTPSKRKLGVLERIRAKLKMKNSKAVTVDSDDEELNRVTIPLNAKKNTRQIEIGWMQKDSKGIKQIRTKKGGGTRKVQIDKTATKEDIKNICKHMFFPNGLSPLGREESFNFDILDFKQNMLSNDATVGSMYELICLPVLRFYLLTERIRQKADETETASLPSLSDDDCFCTDSFSETSSPSTSQTPNGKAALPPKAVSGDVGATSSATRSFVDEISSTSTLNTGATSSSTLDPCDGEQTSSQTGQAFDTNQCFDVESSLSPTNTGMDILEIATWVSGIGTDPEIQFGHQPQNQTLDETLPLVPLMEKSSSTDGHIGAVQTIRIHRGQALHDMIKHFENTFLDPYSIEIVIDMVLPNGTLEMAEDNGGVLRDCITEFWEDFYEKCTNGCDSKVPFLRHDYEKPMWVAVAKIIVIGWKQEGYFPIRISKPFIEECLFGRTTSDVIAAFMDVVSETDKDIMNQALTDFSSVDYDELLDVLDHWHCKTRPLQENIHTIIRQMSEKAILHEPNLIAVLWSDVFKKLSINKENLDNLYSHLKPTARDILKRLVWPASMSSNESIVAKHLQRFIKDITKQLQTKFLRFVTGSDLLIKDQIFVRFVDLQGLGRRPVAHTCGCVLELPNSYESFADFKCEFKSVLENGVWVMDII